MMGHPGRFEDPTGTQRYFRQKVLDTARSCMNEEDEICLRHMLDAGREVVAFLSSLHHVLRCQ